MNAEDRQALKDIIPNADDWPEDRNPRVYSRSTTVQFRGVDLKLQVEADYDSSPLDWLDGGEYSRTPKVGAFDLLNECIVGDELEAEYADVEDDDGETWEEETGNLIDAEGVVWCHESETDKYNVDTMRAIFSTPDFKSAPYDHSYSRDGAFWIPNSLKDVSYMSELTDEKIEEAIQDWNELMAFAHGDMSFFVIVVTAYVEGEEISESSLWGVAVESLADEYLNDEVLNLAVDEIENAPENVKRHLAMNDQQSVRFADWLKEFARQN